MKPAVPTTGSFILDAEGLCTPDNGTTLRCGGFVNSGTLKTLWAKAVATPSNPSDHSHPYEHTASNLPHGPFNVAVPATNPWSITGIPLNGLTTFALYVWGLFDSSTFIPATGGGGQEYTLGSGSGSVGSCGSGGPGFTALAAVQKWPRRAVVEAMPRVYRLSIDVRSMNLAAFGAGYLGEGLLQSASIYLTYDERISTPVNPVWTARNLADATGLWTLRVALDNSSPVARVYFQQMERRKVVRPLVWRTSKWNFNSCNTLSAERPDFQRLALPRVRVVPA